MYVAGPEFKLTALLYTYVAVNRKYVNQLACDPSIYIASNWMEDSFGKERVS